MKLGRLFYTADRRAWRRWLREHHATAKEIWLVYYRKDGARPRLPYNDAVEEALCFGWIDSVLKKVDARRFAQRFTPRRTGSAWSAMNLERARRLIAKGLMTAAGRKALGRMPSTRAPAVAPDLLRALKRSPRAWANFRRFPASYRRIRIGWIEAARPRPSALRVRLAYFVKMTAANKRFGMVR